MSRAARRLLRCRGCFSWCERSGPALFSARRSRVQSDGHSQPATAVRRPRDEGGWQAPLGERQSSAAVARSLPEVRQSCIGACTRITEHADGKVERAFADGRREVRFTNGTSKHIFPSGLVAVQFANGDMKKNLPTGDVEYYYREVDTWHITWQSGVEVRWRAAGLRRARLPAALQ